MTRESEETITGSVAHISKEDLGKWSSQGRESNTATKINTKRERKEN